MSELALFQRFWRDFLKQLVFIVNEQGGRLLAPATLQITPRGSDLQHVSILEPIMFYNAPYKAGSRKGTAKRAIFVDGNFELAASVSGYSLVAAACNLLVYDTEEVAGQSYVLTLADSLHFDMENAQSQNDFHPMFHVQRGYSAMIGPDIVSRRAQVASRLTNDKIEVKNGAQSVENLRLPTPQMDLLSVLTTVIADFFCHKGSSRPEKDAFHELLKSLLSNKNLVCDGVSAKTLAKRWEVRPPFAAGHWYKEGSGLGRPDQARGSAQEVAGPA